MKISSSLETYKTLKRHKINIVRHDYEIPKLILQIKFEKKHFDNIGTISILIVICNKSRQ